MSARAPLVLRIAHVTLLDWIWSAEKRKKERKTTTTGGFNPEVSEGDRLFREVDGTVQLGSALPARFHAHTQTHTASTPLSDELLAQFQFMTSCGRWKNKNKKQARFETFPKFFFFLFFWWRPTDRYSPWARRHFLIVVVFFFFCNAKTRNVQIKSTTK